MNSRGEIITTTHILVRQLIYLLLMHAKTYIIYNLIQNKINNEKYQHE